MKITEDRRAYNKQYRIDNKEMLKLSDRQKYIKRKKRVLERCKEYRIENIEKCKQAGRLWYIKNKELVALKGKEYRIARKDKPNYEDIKKQKADYLKEYYIKNKASLLIKREDNKEKIHERSKEYYRRNIEKVRAYRIKNKEKIAEEAKKYRLKNRKKTLEALKKWRENNRGKRNQYSKQYFNNRKKTDPLFKLSVNLRQLLSRYIKKGGYTKKSRTCEILGAEFDIVKRHLENQFIKGMTWDNHGMYGWHIDHIIPCASAKSEQELIELNHYTNLQPMWAKENISKGAKILKPIQKVLAL